MEDSSNMDPDSGINRSWFERLIWSRALLIGLYLLFALGIIYLGIKVFSTTGETGLDFRVIWLAGRMWLDGVNPYGEEFLQYYNVYFGYIPGAHTWVYPPNWAPVAMTLGALPFSIAEYIWRVVNFAAVLGTVLISFNLVRDRLDARMGRYALLAGAAFLLFLKATPMVVWLGQTTILVTFGLCLWVYCGKVGKPFFSGLGLFLLLLKPQIAIIPLIVFFVAGLFRKGLVWGVALTIAAAMIPVISIGLMETASGFLHNLSLYNAPHLSVNSPVELTGIIHLYDVFFSTKLEAAYLVPFAVSLSVLVGFSWRQKAGDTSLISSVPAHFMLAFLIALIAVIMPLHTYDFVIFGPIALFVFLAKGWGRVLIIAGLFLMFRAGNIADITGFKSSGSLHFPGSLIASVSAIVVLIGASIPVISSWLRLEKTQPVKDT